MERAPLTAGFTGRSRELGMLDERLASARSGVGSLVLVRGEAGIGKTTFCREVVAQARRHGFAVAWGACWPAGGAPPLWPWRQVLDNLSGGRAGQLLVDDHGGTSVDPERFSRFAAVLEELANLCRTRPSVIVIDDAQAADAGALLLARFVARNLADLPLVLILTSRTGPREIDETVDLGSEATLIGLNPFGTEETADLLRSRGLAPGGDDLLNVLVRLTGGHPLYLQRVLAAGGGEALDSSSPRGVQSAIRQAIDQLDDAAQLSLTRSAVLGPDLTTDVAAVVADVPVVVIEGALEEALRAGLVEQQNGDPMHFAYAHELVREAFVGRLSSEERVACHARAAAVLAPAVSVPGTRHSGPGSWARFGQHAYHAVQAASRSVDDARRAVTACRSTATAMIQCYAYEQAVSLLDSAVAVLERSDRDDPVAEVLVERAEAVLRCGRLTEARRHFDEAVTAAIAEEDVACLARAALGLGGVWVNEHRTVIEWDRVTGLQRRALAGLPSGQRALRQRLTMRLAAEQMYRGGPVGPVLGGLDEARELGDGTALAEALSLAHHALLTAGHTRKRLPLAEELIAVAAPAGEGLLALFGLCWRTVDLFHLGDARAARSLSELRERADALGCLSVLHAADAMAVMLLIRAGRLDEAEKRAYACFELGTRVGDPDATGYLIAQLSTIRWCQGRVSELVGDLAELADSSSLNPAEFGFHASAAHTMARAGRLDEARAMLAALVEPGLDRLPDSSTWLAGMLGIVETARLLGDVEVCRQAYALLLPYADLPIMPSLAVTCLGSVHRPLGLAALATGDHDLGIHHLTSAIKANRVYGNRPLTAIATAELAEAYLDGSDPAGRDRERAVDLLTAACAEASAIGMTGFSEVWERRRDEIRDDAGFIERRGERWVLRLGGQSADVADRLGMRYLAQLLTNPGRSIAAYELAAGGGETAVGPRPAQPILDEQAKQEYRRRLTALATAIEQAEEDGDDRVAENLRTEREALIDELRRVTGLGGRTRGFADSGERARTAVRKALMRAVDDITSAEPEIGRHILATLTTGSTCSYTPDPRHPVHWRSIQPLSQNVLLAS